jgi:hypothetical protein
VVGQPASAAFPDRREYFRRATNPASRPRKEASIDPSSNRSLRSGVEPAEAFCVHPPRQRWTEHTIGTMRTQRIESAAASSVDGYAIRLPSAPR